MSSIIGGTPFHLNVNVVTLAAEHLSATARATLDVATPMVIMSVKATAVRASFTRHAPAFLTVPLPRVGFAVTMNDSDGTAFRGKHFSSADIALGHYSDTTFRQTSSP